MPTQTRSRVSSVVMRRVRLIHALSPLMTAGSFAALLLLLALYGIGREVWVAHVLANMPPLFQIGDVARFAVAAFVNTRFVVQVLSVVALGAFIWVMRDLVRLLPLTQRQHFA